MSVYLRARSGGIIGIFLSIFLNLKVCYVFPLESPHQGDSSEYTLYTIFNIKENRPEFFQGTKERVRDVTGKRSIGV